MTGRATTVLVVEGDETLRRLLRRALERLQCRVLLAADGKSALALFQHAEDRIGLVISEELLPGMSGSRLAEELRGHDPMIPVLLVGSAFEGPPGAFPQLEKPFSLAELERRINDVLAVSAGGPPARIRRQLEPPRRRTGRS